MTEKTTICVLIMFTNEEHCILETLNSTLPYANEYILCDNASTDNTVEVCENFFKQNNIKGQVFNAIWKNFGYNYSYLYELGHKHATSEYLWQIDADDIVIGVMKINNLWADRYLLQFGDTMKYLRCQIFKNTFKWQHILAIHGYTDTLPKGQYNTTKKIKGNYYIDSRHIGNRHKIDSDLKFLNDAKMLEEDLLTNLDKHDESRCYFYLGQCYKDGKAYQKSIDAYNKRISMNGWEEEVYYSKLQIARCYKVLNDIRYIDMYLTCFEQHPNRVEPLYELGVTYLLNKNYKEAKKYFKQASNIPYPVHLTLFLSKDVYDYRCHIDLAICYYYLQKYNKSYDINNKLLLKSIPDDIKIMIEENNQFNLKHTIYF